MRDKDGKEKFKAPRKPVCVGCLRELKPPTVKPDWCDSCWGPRMEGSK